MKKRLLSTVLALFLCVSAVPGVYAAQEDFPLQENLSEEEATAFPVPDEDGKIPAYQEVYDTLIKMKEMDAYKEGAAWTYDTPYSDGNYYHWHGGPLDGKNIVATGCAAFAFELSDAAFGSLPARMYSTGQFTLSDVKAGDILRVDNDSHTVIVLQVSDAGVVIAEGNYSGKVHWERVLSKTEVEAASHYITRYPENYIDPGDLTANDVIEKGTAGTLAWTLTKAGTLTVSGSGAMPDYSAPSEQPWNDYTNKIHKIVIENGVTSIGNSAFYNSKALSITLPSSVTNIGSSAFYGSSLLSVTIPASVKTIGNDAFRVCPNLVSVTVSEGVESVGERAFQGCQELDSIVLPASIGNVGAGAFMECTSMSDVTFTPGSKQVKIGDNLFTRCYNLERVTLPKSVDCIGEGMFQNDGMLARVEIPQGATSIGGLAFASSGVKVVIIPGSVETIGIAAFSACPLSDIYFTGTEAQWKAVGKIGDTASAVSKAAIHYNYANSGSGTETAPSEHIHSWAAEWSNDETHHWHDCMAPDCTLTGNSQKNGYAVHIYDDDADAACNTCNYIRTTPDPDPGTDPTPEHTHSWTAAWSSSATHHWHICTAPDCTITDNSQKNGYTAHVYSSNVDTTCDICGYIRTVSGGDFYPYPYPSSSGSGSNGPSTAATTTTSTPTTRNPDGSTTTRTENKTTGTITETTKKTDGTLTVVETRRDGITTVVTTSASGQVEAEVTLPAATVIEAQRTGEAVTLPIHAVRATKNTASAPAVTVKAGRKGTVKVEIPTENVTSGTVAVTVNAGGSEEVVRATIPTENGIVVSLPDGATVKIVDNSKNFTDVTTAHWANNAINFVSARELFSGTTAATFAPEAPMTRAMLMTVLARYDGEDTSSGAVWYEKGMEWAVANEISDGSNPNDNIAREQLITMLWRYSGSPAANNTLNTFTDAGEISGYAREAMCWAVEKGIINGFGNGRLNPREQATRAEVAIIIMQYSSNA